MKTRQITLFILFLFPFNFCDSTDPKPPDNKPPGYQEDIPWPSLADSPWPINHHDPQSTGRSKYPGPTLGSVGWSYDVNYIQGATTMGSDSIIYIPDSEGLTALNLDGSLKWKYEINGQIIMAPLVANDGSIYFVNYLNDTFLAVLNSDGSLKWNLDLGKHIGPNMITIDRDGNIYVVADHTLLCVTQSGSILWELNNNDFNSYGGNGLSFSPDGKLIFIPGITASLLAVDIHTKNVIWVYGNETLSSPPMVDSQGNIYFIPIGRMDTDSIRHLYSVSNEGILRWKYAFLFPPASGLVLKSPSIDKTGNIYFATDSLYSINYKGELNWVNPLTGICDCPIVSDFYSNIYVATQTGIEQKVYLYCFDKNGILKWSLDFISYQVGQSPTITSEEGMIFSPWRGSKTYYIN